MSHKAISTPDKACIGIPFCPLSLKRLYTFCQMYSLFKGSSPIIKGCITFSTIYLFARAILPGPKHSPHPVIPSSVSTSTRWAVRCL